MLGKEWLQNYDGTGPPSLLPEEQGRLRQQKYDGAKRWHLEETVKFLPNILLFSVLLFFVGLVQLLIPMNKVVGGFVIALVGAGTILSLATIVAGTFLQHCPYQNALSRGLRWVGRDFVSRYESTRAAIKRVWTSLVLGIRSISQFHFRSLKDVFHLGGGSGNVVATVAPPSSVSNADEDQIIPSLLGNVYIVDRVNFQAAYWILSMTTNLDDQLVVAQNICTLTARTCYIMGQHFSMWRYLLRMTFQALIRWKDQPENANNRATAEQFGVALYHSLAGYSPQSIAWEMTQNLRPMFHSHTRSLYTLAFVTGRARYEFRLGDVVRKSEFATLDFRFRKAILHSELLFTDKQLPWDLMAVFLSNQYDDGILSMLAFHIVRCYHGQEHVANATILAPDVQDHLYWRMKLLSAYDGENLYRNISEALNAGVLVFDKHLDSWDGPAEVYITFVRIMLNGFTSKRLSSTLAVNPLIKLVTKVEWKIQVALLKPGL